MIRSYDQNQNFLLPPSLHDFIPASHPAHLINDLVEKMDTQFLKDRYGPLGQPAYDPTLMIKVILYGFTVGIFSSRKLQRATQENMAFKYLAAMETPAFKTFIEFRQRHREDMKKIFLQTVKLAKNMGLVRLGSVALDGTKIEANASKHKAMSYGRMLEEEKRLQEEIEGLLKSADKADQEEDKEHGPGQDGFSLPEELAFKEARLKKIQEAKEALEERERKEHPDDDIDPKKQVAFADTQARCFSKNSEGTKYIYNSQAAVDMESQIIVENHIEESVSDAHAAKEALREIKQDLGETPKNLVTDAGYAPTATLKACQDEGVTPICAVGREAQETEPEKLDSFLYDERQNQFTCPHGNLFVFDHEAQCRWLVYQTLHPIDCICGGFIFKKSHRQSLRVSKAHVAKRKLKAIMQEDGHRKLYARRKTTIEPVFGQIKQAMGFRRYFYRGAQRVRSEWNIVCAALNLRKMARVLNNSQKISIAVATG